MAAKPKEENTPLWMAMACLKKGQTAKAEELFAKAVQLDPKDEDNYLDMAEVYAEKGQASKVEELIAKAVSYAPKRRGSFCAPAWPF